MKRRALARGSMASRYGSRQTKVQTARRESVCVGALQVSNRMIRVWKTKMIPILVDVSALMLSEVLLQ